MALDAEKAEAVEAVEKSSMSNHNPEIDLQEDGKVTFKTKLAVAVSR